MPCGAVASGKVALVFACLLPLPWLAGAMRTDKSNTVMSELGLANVATAQTATFAGAVKGNAPRQSLPGSPQGQHEAFKKFLDEEMLKMQAFPDEHEQEQAEEFFTPRSSSQDTGAPSFFPQSTGNASTPGKRRLVLMLANGGSGRGMGANVVSAAGNLGAKFPGLLPDLDLEARLVKLGTTEPEEAIQEFLDKKRPAESELVRVVIVGGDGTVSALIPSLRRVFGERGLESCWAIATLPLGTGNDFSRTLGYGGTFLECADEDERCAEAVGHRLGKIVDATRSFVDQWRFALVPHAPLDPNDWKVPGASVVEFHEEALRNELGSHADALLGSRGANGSLPSHDAALFTDTNFFITGKWLNYLTWGMDAKIAADVDDFRHSNPGTNLKIQYVLGALRADWNLRKFGSVKGAMSEDMMVRMLKGSEMAEVSMDRRIHHYSAGFFNIPSYSSGVNPFPEAEDTSIPWDGELELGSHSGSVFRDMAPSQCAVCGFSMHAHGEEWRVDFSKDFVQNWADNTFAGGLPVQHDGERWPLLTTGATLFVVRNLVGTEKAQVPVLVAQQEDFSANRPNLPDIFDKTRAERIEEEERRLDASTYPN